MDVRNKVTIITGASAGIGLAAARRFARAGAVAVLVARSADMLKRLEEELRGKGSRALALPTDMRSGEQIKAMIDQTFEKFGRLDILVNNAGQAAWGKIVDLKVEHFRQVMELNVFAPFLAMQMVIPKMRRGGGGLIINVSSMVSKMQIPALGGYASTKAALNMLSATAAVELASENIKVITMYPRLTLTDFARNSLGLQVHQRPAGSEHVAIVADTPEQVAEKILEAAEKEPAEMYMGREEEEG